MKLTAFFLLVCMLQINATTYSQKTRITLDMNDVQLSEVLNRIETISEFKFFVDTQKIDVKREVDINVDKEKIFDILDKLFQGTDITYEVYKKQILLKKVDVKTTESKSIGPNQRDNEIKNFQKIVTGTITDDKGAPLVGANILEKGTTNGTQADFDGNFSISVEDENSVLVISYVGFGTKEIALNGQTLISVTLEESAVGMDEVVVIGYGTTRKSDLTGAVSSIKPEEALQSPSPRVDQVLQGRASGVYVTSMNGAPGSGATIRIRGGNSITAGNEPLYVIDGFIGGGDLNTISTSDIESIEILKDASSTSIYGTRGANGVILITTKKGKEQKSSFRVTTTQGFNEIPGVIDFQSPAEFARYRNEGLELQGGTPIYDVNELPMGGNWLDEGLRKGYITDSNISLTGGNDKTKYYLSGNYFLQKGVLKANEFKRFSFNSKLDQKVSNLLSIDANFTYSHTYSDNPKYSYATLLRMNPLTSIYDENGRYNFRHPDGTIFENPFEASQMITNETIGDRVLAIANLNFSIANGLKLKSSVGGDLMYSTTNNYTPGAMSNRIVQDLGGTGGISNSRSFSLLNENILSYNHQINKLNSFDVLTGFTFQTFEAQNSALSGSQLINDVTKFYALEMTESEFRDISSGYNEWGIVSFIGRLNYSYADKYLLTASFRRDGTSKLGSNNKWANFPSAAIAWRLINESFIEDLNIFDNLKLRASYGLTGNQGIPAFSTLASLGTTQVLLNEKLVNGTIQLTLENPNLKWETTGQFDLGLEAGFLNNRLSFEFDYYYKKTNDLLYDVEIPFVTGFSTQTQNVGSLQNQGVDFAANAFIISNNDFSWNFSANISHYKNKILNLGGKESINGYQLSPPSRQYASELMVGKPLGVFVGYTYDGIDQETGDLLFKDISGDGNINDDDVGIIGDPNPKFFGGIQNNFKYKNIGLSIFFQGSYGNDLYNTSLFTSSGLSNSNNYTKLYEGRWTVDNPLGATTVAPGVERNILLSNSSFIQNGSYLRLKTIELSYTLPQNKLFTACRFYLTGTNFFLVKDRDYLNYDPEVSQFGAHDVHRGFDNILYPQNRSYIIGMDIKF